MTKNLAGRVLVPFAAGYFLSYVFRTVNAVLAPDIAEAMMLDAGDIGLMTGAYFMAFAAAQLPLGLLLDRFGPRRVEAALLLFAAAGAVAFSMADNVGMLILGRALVGFGVSSCLMAALKANVQWFPHARLPLTNGIILSAGGLGAVAATGPVQAALVLTDWRGVYALLGLLTVVVAVGLFLAVPRGESHRAAGSLGEQVAAILDVTRDPGFRRLAPIAMLAMGGFLAVQGLWAGAWLRDVAGLSPTGVAEALTAMAAAMAVGYLSLGAVAERLARRGIPTIRVAVLGMALFWCAGLALALGWTGAPMALAALYGFAGTAGSLLYTVLSQSYPSALAGRVNATVNLTVFVAAFSLQWGLGVVIGLWPHTGAGWPPQAYTVALLIPVVLQGLALLWFIAAKGSAARSSDRR